MGHNGNPYDIVIRVAQIVRSRVANYQLPTSSAMAVLALLAMLRAVRVLAPWLDSSEIAHRSRTINGVPRPKRTCTVWKWTAAAFYDISKMHRSLGNYPEQSLKLGLLVVCVYVYMYASNFTTLNNTHFILLHEYINSTTHWRYYIILNTTTGRYTPDSTVLSLILYRQTCKN